ncbi:unnamed protein product [Echinostoma caproni]|uniref:Uncharacterized protein n=1 Tax=Echinostoma caproni TaxID=27848 RepID=A0A3P8INY1_9TREM|nr:unnamed protein product [Echinostoma caproni]
MSAILSKWRRITADKPWGEVQRLVADEILRLESGQIPPTVRTSRAPRHRSTMTPGSGTEQPPSNARESVHRSDAL